MVRKPPTRPVLEGRLSTQEMRTMSILRMTDEQFKLWELGLLPDTYDDEEDETPSRRRRR